MPIDASLGPCLNWGGAKTAAGYGTVRIAKEPHYAHRVSLADFLGMTLEDLKASGLHVRHKCDNPSCFHPLHLELGTHADNMRDKVLRGRNQITPEVRVRKSEAQRRRFAEQPVSDETRQRLSESHRGNRHSAETLAKMSASQTGRRASDETRARLRAAWVIRRAQKETTCPR